MLRAASTAMRPFLTAIVAFDLLVVGCTEPEVIDDEELDVEPVVEDPLEPEDVPTIGAPAPTLSTCSFSSGDNLAKLRCYTCQKACDDARPSYCSGGGWPTSTTSCIAATTFANQVVYRWYEAGSDNPESPQNYLRPFVLLGYMRLLRNEAGHNAAYEPILTAQVDYLLSTAKPFPADDKGPASRGWQTYFRRSDGVVRRYVDGLTQVGYAQYFASVARSYLGNPTKRDRYLNLALEFDNTMERPAGNKTGGVRVINPLACGAPGLEGPCWYFHSRAPSDQFVPGTSLNQSLYVTRSALQLLSDLSATQFDTSFASTISRDAWRERLRDRAANALSQWAFGAGNSASAPSQPPNLRQHWMPKSIGTANAYYWSFYQFDLANHVPANKASAKHVCNYHTVNLNNLAGILSTIDTDGASLGTGVRRDRLDKARNALLTYTRQGIPEPRGSATARLPVYQWFLAEIDPAIREDQQGCEPAGADGLEGLFPASKQYLCSKFGGGGNPALVGRCP